MQVTSCWSLTRDYNQQKTLNQFFGHYAKNQV
jgi:hypothetical protein